MYSICILHNTRAGQPGYAQQLEQAADDLTRRGVPVRLEQSGDMAVLRQAAREAVTAGVSTVLVAGGDGTVGTIAGELADSQVALGVLPAGTANVLAQALRLPRPAPWRPDALAQATRLLLDAPAQLTDLGCANDRYFLVWAGMGLDAVVTQHFEAQRRRSRQVWAYAYNVGLTFAVAFNWRGLDLTLRASGPLGAREASGHYLMATVCNTGLHGGGLFQFAADPALDDGLMDLWAFEGSSNAEGLTHAVRVAAGRHEQSPGVVRMTGDRFELEASAPQSVQIDAEPQPATTRLAVQVLPHSLRLLVPRTAAAQLYHDG